MAEAKNEDGLFLLEALVDKVVFAKAPLFPDREFRTCVGLQCAAVEPLEICDDNPAAVRAPNPHVKHFNNGKSCLFSLKQSEINEAMCSFPIKMSVYKALPCGFLPKKIVIGEATIDMTKEFVRARQKFFEDPAAISYEALKDTFRISTPDGADAGEVAMFLRITCFGSMIITRFQGSGVPPALGASGGSEVVKQSCAGPREFAMRDTKCTCGSTRTNTGDSETHSARCARSAESAGFIVCPTAVYQTKTSPPEPGSPTSGSIKGSVTNHEIPCPNSVAGGGKGACTTAVDPYNSMPCIEPDDPCFCCGPKAPAKEQMMCRNTDQYCLHVPKGRTKQFEEIGTNLNGNELKIKVPASASIIKKISQTHCAMQRPYVKAEGGGARAGADGPCAPPCGKNQISMGLPCEDICCRGARPQTTQFTCTTEGCTQASKHAQQAAMARGEKAKAELVNNNVFVLKVAKTAMQGDRKCKLELELVTPKGPDKDHPVEKTTRRMQCDPDCDCNRLKKPQKKKKLY